MLINFRRELQIEDLREHPAEMVRRPQNLPAPPRLSGQVSTTLKRLDFSTTYSCRRLLRVPEKLSYVLAVTLLPGKRRALEGTSLS